MGYDGEPAVGLFDIQVGSIRGDAQGIVISSVNNHTGTQLLTISEANSEKESR